MIPLIGVMMGLYIVTQCASLVARKGEREEALVVKVLAIVTALFCALGIVGLALG